MSDEEAGLYPWHDALWASLTSRRARLPHALLFQGNAGLGKQALAQRFAAWLLCADPTPLAACGRCHSCRLRRAGNHPDFKLLAPAEDRRQIVVDQVRELGGFLELRPHTAARKVALLTPADSLNLHAANSLLKILEEPPSTGVLCLVSHQPARLPATVRSRAQRVMIAAPARAQALTWLTTQGVAAAELPLDLAAGAPLRALALANSGFLAQREALLRDLEALLTGQADPISCAARWKGAGAQAGLEWLAGFVSDLIRCAMAAKETGRVSNPEAHGFLQKHKNALYLNRLFMYLDLVSNARNALFSGSLDELLVCEDLMIHWCYMKQGTSTITDRAKAAS